MTTVVQGAVQGCVLSLVIEYPGRGHAIGTRFEERFRGIIGSSRQHVYPALYALRDAGLVAASGEAIEPLRPSKRLQGDTFRATAQGVAAWRAWLAQPLSSRDAAKEMLARMYAAAQDDWATMLVILDLYEAAMRDHAAARSPQRRDPGDGPELLDLLARDYEGALLDANLAWVESARERIERRMPAR